MKFKWWHHILSKRLLDCKVALVLSGCSNPVGLEGTAEDSQFSSYTHMVGWDAFMARLFHDHAWCSATNDIKLEFLQIDLGSVRHISCIATQGVRSWDPLFSSYVITFMIKYSNNGTTWFIYKGSGGSVQVSGIISLNSLLV